jgi:hypothetical protein
MVYRINTYKEEKEERMGWWRETDFWEKLRRGSVLLGVGGAVVVSVFLASQVKECWSSSNAVSYCFIEGQNGKFLLKAHHEWDHDFAVGLYDTADEAIDVAHKMDCKLNQK